VPPIRSGRARVWLSQWWNGPVAETVAATLRAGGAKGGSSSPAPCSPRRSPPP